jgi:hypothetical protein
MTRLIWDAEAHEFVEPHAFYRKKYSNVQRSGLPRPMLIADTTGEFLSHVDGKTYSSKHAYRESLREHNRIHGTELVEVGNDTSYVTQDLPDASDMTGDPAKDVAQAWEQLS